METLKFNFHFMKGRNCIFFFTCAELLIVSIVDTTRHYYFLVYTVDIDWSASSFYP